MSLDIAVAQLPGYTQRLKGHVNSAEVFGSTDLTNFPVLISFTSARFRHTSSGGEVENINGYDILFTTDDGSTIMSHQIENYEPTTGELVFWVRFPTLSTSTDTEFYIYFGNSSVSTDPSSVNVWDSNYKMVLHLDEENPVGTFPDASGEGTDGTDTGTILTTGQIGGGVDFNGTGDRITVVDNGVSPLDISGSITISFWLRIANLASGPDILTKGDYLNGYSVWANSSGVINFQINNDALSSPGGQLTNNVWSYISLTRASNGDRTIYVDGAEVASDNSNESFNIDDEDLFLSTASFWPYLGDFDEVRISNSTRDSAWIATEYSNQNAPGPGFFIDQVNAEPILDSIEVSTLTYNSGDSPTAITTEIQTYDGDDTDIENATIEITGNYDSSEDVLAFTDQLGITGSWDAINGILTLTGTSSVANYQTALRAVTYENTDPAPVENTRTVTYTINDGDDDSNSKSRNISVVKVNIAPVLSDIETSSIVYFAGGGQTSVTNSIELVDADDVFIDSAFVEITSGYLSAEDTLYFIDQNGITGSWDDLNGKLTLTGDTLVANYESAIRSITYENTSGSPTTTTRTISITANDGTEDGNTVNRNIDFPSSISELVTYKGTDVFHYDAQDADGDGDPTTNQPVDGALSSWGDRSNDAGGSSNDLSATTTGGQEPVLDSNLLGNRIGLSFNGVDESFNPPNDTRLNTATYTEKSFAMVFRTGTSTAGLQILFEQGGGTRGYQISIKDGNLYAYVWNNSEWGAGDQDKSINLGSVEINTTYIVIASHDATSAVSVEQVWEANVNGGAINTLTDVDFQRAHSGGAEIGEEDGTLDPVTEGSVPGGTNPFEGVIAEFISWNNALSATDFTNIYGFLSDKWLNVPPVLSSLEIPNISYTEGDPATVLTSTLSIANDDSVAYDRSIDSAKVSISVGFDGTEDVLALPAPVGGITGSYDSGSGVLTLSGNETIANYETALQSITYQNTDGTSPSETTRQIDFVVYDWDDISNTVSRNIEITPLNAAPSLAAIEGSTLAFTENDGPTAITSTLTVTDSDDTNLDGATIAFTNNYFLGEDVLGFSTQNGIIGSFDSPSGVLTLSGSSSVANYQTALRSVTFENISSDPVTGLDREITFRVFDGIDSSGVQSRDVSVASLNTAPSLSSIEGSSLFYLAGDTTIISETLALSDPDDTDIETATIQITASYNSAEDSLLFEDIFGITDSWNDVSGILTLTGPASKSDFESALRTVQYLNTAGTPTDTPRDVTFTINDGTDNSNTQVRSISFSIPKSVSGLLVWLKGDAGTYTNTGCSTTATDTDPIGCWEDQSGNGNDFISSGAASPTFDAIAPTINSQAAIEFPGGGSNVRLEDADAETQYLDGLSGLTIFFVIESDITATDRGFWATETPGASTTDQYFSLRYDATGTSGGASNVVTAGLRDQTAFTLESFADAQTTLGQIVMLKWTSETTYDMYIDGVLSNPTSTTSIPTGTLDAANLTTAIIGQGPLDNNTSWDGLIAEVILYDNEITLTDQESVEDYLSNKYDIAIRSLTPARGGEAISADDASIAPSPAFTTLTGPRVQESFVGEFSTGTFIFQAPTGFEWDTGGGAPSASVAAAFGGTTDLAISFTSRTASQITFTVTAVSTTNPAEITFSDFRVRPTTGTLPNSGNITNVGTTGLGGSTDYGDLTMVAGTQIAMEYAQQPGVSNVSSAITPSPRIQLVDQFGNSVEESRVDITMALNQVSGTGVLDGASTTLEETNLFGIAEFDNLIVDDTGTYSLTGSSTGLSDTTSNDFDVVVLGQLTGFTVERVPFGNISDKQAGQTFNITIVAVDGIQDTVTSFTGTISLTSNCTIGTGAGTSPSFTAGVLSSLTVSISSTGTCSLTATNTSGSEEGTSNTFTVTPGAASETTTTISASPTVIFNDGFATSTITVQTKDSEGNNRTVGGETIALSVTSGSLGSVTDNSNGTYTATLTSSIIAGTATVTGTLNAVSISDNAQVEYAEFNTQWQSQVGSVSDARNWDDATNWSAGVVPGASDKVLIPATPSVGNEQPVVSLTNTTIEQISIENSATVTVSGGINFIVTGEASGEGEILGSNTDSLTVGGDIDLNDIAVGTVILNGTANQIVTSPNTFTNLELDNSNGADFAGNVTVSDSLKLVDGVMFLPSGSNLIANSKNYGSGSIRMQREITGSIGWRLISSPFNTTYGDLLDGTITQGYTGAFYSTGSNPGDTLQPNVLTYLESFVGTDNQRYRTPTSAATNVTQGQGMFVFFFGDIPADVLYNEALPDTLDASGQEWDGDGTEVDFGITYTATADSGWNLVGNPFAATIDWDDGANWTKTNVESVIYIWDPAANGGDGEYLTWNGVSGTLPSNGLIAPFQGFWVKANDTSPVLKVNKDAKTTGDTFLRKTISEQVDTSKDSVQTKAVSNETQIPQIQLAVVSNTGRSKKTNIIFTDNARTGKDDLDAYTLIPLSTSHIEFNTLLNNGTELAINNLPLDFNSRNFIPLHFDSFENGLPTSGTFEMIWGDFRSIPEDWILVLIDNETGEEINLKEQLSYEFNHSTRAKIRRNNNPLSPDYQIRGKARSMNTRFTLKVSTEQIERDVPEQIFLNQNYPNPFNPSTTIEFGLDQTANVVLEVYDILGRKIQTILNEQRNPGRYQTRFDARTLASGVYFYRLQANDEVFIKRMTFIK